MITTCPPGRVKDLEKGWKMTVKQFRKKVDIARQYGEAKLDSGCTLLYFGPCCSYSWSLRDEEGNTVDIVNDPKELEYLFD